MRIKSERELKWEKENEKKLMEIIASKGNPPEYVRIFNTKMRLIDKNKKELFGRVLNYRYRF